MDTGQKISINNSITASSIKDLPTMKAPKIMRNFISMGVFFSLTHASTGACLSLSSARLKEIGAWQSGILYLTYTASAVSGATYVCKLYGGRNSMALGMMLLCVYIGCTAVYLAAPEIGPAIVLIGAFVGGAGAGILWTAQGLYFAQSAEDFAAHSSLSLQESTSRLAGNFGFIFLGMEMILRILSSLILYLDPAFNWDAIFELYTMIAFLGAVVLRFSIHNYPATHKAKRSENVFHQITAAIFLLVEDPKMKYLIFLNVAFGFCGSFVNSYIGGEVVEEALGDTNSVYVGALAAWLSFVAAITSLLYSYCWPSHKGFFVVLGGISTCLVSLPFLSQPNPANYDLTRLIMIYTFWGIGRASSESTYKAVFADFFLDAKEAAFANIVLQNGLASSVGYVASFNIFCSEQGSFCIRFADGTLHNVFTLASLTFGFAVLGILGFLFANTMHSAEQRKLMQATDRLHMMA